MTYVIWALVGLLVITIVWRFASRRESIPCPVWLRWMVEMDNPFTRVNRSAVIVSLLGPIDGLTVLDAGCGPGRLTMPLARTVGPQGRVVALDIQQGMLDAVRKKAEAEGLSNIEFMNAGLGEGKLGPSQFDRVVLVTVLGEIPDRQAAMNELAASLKPEGLLSITELVFDPHFQRRGTVTALAAAAGLREVAFHGRGHAYTVHLMLAEQGNASRASVPQVNKE